VKEEIVVQKESEKYLTIIQKIRYCSPPRVKNQQITGVIVIYVAFITFSPLIGNGWFCDKLMFSHLILCPNDNMIGAP